MSTIDKVFEQKKDALSYIRSKGIPERDAEDVFQESMLELHLYYDKALERAEDVFKVFSLAVNSQVSKYFKAHGKVAPPKEESLAEDSGFTFDQLFEQQSLRARSPLSILIEQEAESVDLGAAIDKFTKDPALRKFLSATAEQGMSIMDAKEYSGVSRSRAYRTSDLFLEYLEDLMKTGG